jgi:hypothetical protein
MFFVLSPKKTKRKTEKGSLVIDWRIYQSRTHADGGAVLLKRRRNLGEQQRHRKSLISKYSAVCKCLNVNINRFFMAECNESAVEMVSIYISE